MQVEPRGLGRGLLLGDLRARRVDLSPCLVARGAGEVEITSGDQLLLRESISAFRKVASAVARLARALAIAAEPWVICAS